MGMIDRLKHAWNSFVNEESNPKIFTQNLGYSTSYRPDRRTFTRGNEKSIVTSVYNRIAIDCSTMPIKHVKLDDNDRYDKLIKSNLNSCLTLEANKDQHARAFMQDIVISLFDEGVVAVVPVDTSVSIEKGSFDIHSMRTGKIIQWYPDHVKVEVYNDREGVKQNLTLPKNRVAIIENPYYAIMNEKNSVLQRLITKLNLLDTIDNQSGSGKLDLIIQLPYAIKSEAREKQADLRKQRLEQQLADSKYGIAYTDGSEKITQLNRPVDNNLLKQVEYLTSMLYSQLGISNAILNGTASETEMLNYLHGTVEPILSAIILEFNRKFLTKTARTQGQTLKYFNDPFRLVTVANLAEVADKFTRNEIMTSNEIRQIIGLKPVNNPDADSLRNKNLNKEKDSGDIKKDGEFIKEKQVEESNSDTGNGEIQNG